MRDGLPLPSREVQAFARELRRPPTPQEQVLWGRLRGRRAGGMKFRRQHPVGPFILDFYCAEARLAVEVDGSVHDVAEKRAGDTRRTEWLALLGIRVMRVTNMEIVLDVEAVVSRIVAEAGDNPHPQPLSPWERGA